MEENQKRITALTDGTSDIVEKIIKKRSEGDAWFLGVDYDTSANPSKTDLGTQKITMSRVALLNKSGLIPASMMPSTVTSAIAGNMEYDSVKKHWKFTAKDGKVYGCPSLATGEVAPDENHVYVDNDPVGEDYYQYMFVPADNPSADDIGTFYCLPSAYMLIDGKATHVHDDSGNFTRAINILTAPSDILDTTTSGHPSIALKDVTSSGKTYKAIAHTAYHGSTKSAGDSEDKTTLPFGGKFKVPYVMVDQSGHVTTLDDHYVTIPNSAATESDLGLCVLSSAGPKAIGSTSSAGTVGTKTIDGVKYSLVSYANHVHAAQSLSIKNGSDRATLTYNGSVDVNIDMDKLVGARLPTTKPSADSVLYCSGTSLEWKSTVELANPAAISVHSPSSIDAAGWKMAGSTTKAVATFESLTVDAKIGDLDVSDIGGTIVGFSAGSYYLVTYSMTLTNSEEAPYYLDFMVGVSLGNNTYIGNLHTVNASITATQYITGSFILNNSSLANVDVCLVATDATRESVMEYGEWEATLTSLQIAELK